ncbi:MAG: FecR domain-containing protein, partial [Bacteroidota bacterium]
MAKKISKELLIKYHQNQCSEVERKAVKEWLELNDAEDASGELELVNREEIDSDQIWFNVSQNVSQLENQRPFLQAVKTRSLAVRYRSYAAAVLVLFAVGFSTYYLFDAIELTGNIKVADQYQTIQTQRGEKRTVTLSDGSTIRMNYETQIQVPEQFEGDERIVYLTGHAHF